MADKDIDLKSAINAISDVIQNRPRPIRTFDQIYMKAGDMVMQSELVAHWSDGKRLIFIGDGDAIGVAVAYLKQRGIINYGPSKILVLDFDERQVSSIKRFADKERIETLDAMRYNTLDALPDISAFDCFYTNPPWGQYNDGNSVNVFMQRGIEAVRYEGDPTQRDGNRHWHGAHGGVCLRGRHCCPSKLCLRVRGSCCSAARHQAARIRQVLADLHRTRSQS